MNRSQIKTSVRTSLATFAHMFEGINEDALNAFQPKEDRIIREYFGIKAIKFSWPYETSRDRTEGFKLCGNKGYISLTEYYELVTTSEFCLIAYVYRYVTEEYSIVWKKNDTGEQKAIEFFSFHYDKDPRHADNLHHLQVMTNTPRYPTDKIKVSEFLRTVDSLCFKQTAPNTEAMFANRI